MSERLLVMLLLLSLRSRRPSFQLSFAPTVRRPRLPSPPISHLTVIDEVDFSVPRLVNRRNEKVKRCSRRRNALDKANSDPHRLSR